MSEQIVPPSNADGQLEWLGLSWADPTRVDMALDDAQGWAERVGRCARLELARTAPLYASILDAWVRIGFESDEDAAERVDLGDFFRAAISEATYYAEWSDRIAVSGEKSLRDCFDEEGWGAGYLDMLANMP